MLTFSERPLFSKIGLFVTKFVRLLSKFLHSWHTFTPKSVDILKNNDIKSRTFEVFSHVWYDGTPSSLVILVSILVCIPHPYLYP